MLLKKQVMKYLFLSFVIFFTTSASSQISYALPDIENKPFPVFWENAIRNNFTNRLGTVGATGVCWIKFRLEQENTPVNIRVSPGTPPALEQLIKEILATTAGQWVSRPQTHWLILPFRYTLQKNGKTDLITPDPFEMEVFFADQDGMNRPSTITLLPALEFESPFDGENNFKRMKLQLAGTRE
jgi:hypothetical protein